MYCSVDDLTEFYKTEIGSIVQNILGRQIAEIWPDLKGLRVLGCGYACPYLHGIQSQNPERVLAMMPDSQGAIAWPLECKNLVLKCSEEALPIENASIDRILLVHHLEYSQNIESAVSEIWRILKPNGRALVVAPNRLGAWVHADWSPLGQGRPFTQGQLAQFLTKQQFLIENSNKCLFVPPMPDSPIMMKSANVIERLGASFLPFVAGLHIVEVSKQIYANVDKTGGGSAVLSKTKEILAGKTRPIAQGFFPSDS